MTQENEIKIRALETALDFAANQLHIFRHGEQSVADLKKVINEFARLRDSRNYFREGDRVKLIEAYAGHKAGDIVTVECCGEELGGIDNIQFVGVK